MFYVSLLLLNFQVIMNFVCKFFSKSKLCHSQNVNVARMFSLSTFQTRQLAGQIFSKFLFTLKYDNCFVSRHPRKSPRPILKARRHILFCNPQKSTSHPSPGRLANTKCNAAQEKFLFSPETNLDNQRNSFNQNNNLTLFRRLLMQPRIHGGSQWRGQSSRM